MKKMIYKLWSSIIYMTLMIAMFSTPVLAEENNSYEVKYIKDAVGIYVNVPSDFDEVFYVDFEHIETGEFHGFQLNFPSDNSYSQPFMMDAPAGKYRFAGCSALDESELKVPFSCSLSTFEITETQKEPILATVTIGNASATADTSAEEPSSEKVTEEPVSDSSFVDENTDLAETDGNKPSISETMIEVREKTAVLFVILIVSAIVELLKVPFAALFAFFREE